MRRVLWLLPEDLVLRPLELHLAQKPLALPLHELLQLVERGSPRRRRSLRRPSR